MNKAEEIAARLTKWANRLGFSTVSGDLSEIIKDIAATHPKESAGVWRKASEKLPETNHTNDRPIKANGFYWLAWYDGRQGKWFTDSDASFESDEVLWLDESQSASAAPTADGIDDKLPQGFKVYQCTDCQEINVKKDNGKITIGICDNCIHPLWNPPTPPTTKKE